eukprot:m.190203 g.190203  ORF g.190203 m.190203 type:complete len:65 (+) comp32396_c1_seq4:145-339(+)
MNWCYQSFRLYNLFSMYKDEITMNKIHNENRKIALGHRYLAPSSPPANVRRHCNNAKHDIEHPT